MPDNERPVGVRFSQLYLERGLPARDSARLRVRVDAYFYAEDISDIIKNFAGIIQQELGVRVPSGSWGYLYHEFFTNSVLHDFLDSITLVWWGLSSRGHTNKASNWLTFVQRAMREENVGYSLDEKGGVHYFVDQEFERNRASAVRSLQSARYLATLVEFEAAHAALDQNPPDGKAAIRGTFEALEILFKLTCGPSNVQRLGTNEVEKNLKPILQKFYAGDVTAWNSANLFINSFKEWVNAAHFYRHGQKSEEPSPPPIELAVALTSSGATYLRWLAEVDQHISAKNLES